MSQSYPPYRAHGCQETVCGVQAGPHPISAGVTAPTKVCELLIDESRPGGESLERPLGGPEEQRTNKH